MAEGYQSTQQAGAVNSTPDNDLRNHLQKKEETDPLQESVITESENELDDPLFTEPEFKFGGEYY